MYDSEIVQSVVSRVDRNSMMVDSYINNYLGDWVDETGNRLNIQKVDDETAFASFFAVSDGKPLYRPWHQNEIP